VALRKLARQFLELVGSLKQHSVAHGDLQHGNVLVAKGQLRLVDYDGMFVPALAGMPSYELGQRNYQHPRRTDQHFGPFIDNFSAWVIYASLVALSVDSSLWYECGGGEEHLLFRREDFVDPVSSDALRALELVAEPAVQSLAASLRSFSTCTDVSRIPPPESNTLPPLPPIVAAPVPDESAAGGGPEWIWGHIKPKPVEVGGSCVQERITFALAAFVAVLVSAIAATPGAVLMAVGMIAGWLGIMRLHYKSFPEVRKRSDLTTQAGKLRGHVREAEQLCAQKEKERTAQTQEYSQKEVELTRKRHECAQRERKEIESCDQELQKQLRDVESQRHALNQANSVETRRALLRLQQQFLAAHLSQHDLASARIQGVGASLKTRLQQAGFRTAADFVDVETRQIGQGYRSHHVITRAFLVGAGGRKIHVEGVGPEKASSLLAWRRAQESWYRPKMPQALPASEEGAIRAAHQNQLQTLANAESRLRQAAQQKKARLQSQYQQEHENVAREQKASQHALAKEIAVVDKKLSELKKRAKDTRWALAQVENELTAYAALSFGAYIKRIVLFRKAA
jgi:thiamine kinase-like enzyme